MRAQYLVSQYHIWTNESTVSQYDIWTNESTVSQYHIWTNESAPLCRLTLYGGDELAGDKAQEPAAGVEALGQGGRQAEGASQQAGDRQVEDEKIPRVAVSSSA